MISVAAVVYGILGGLGLAAFGAGVIFVILDLGAWAGPPTSEAVGDGSAGSPSLPGTGTRPTPAPRPMVPVDQEDLEEEAGREHGMTAGSGA